MKCNRFHVVFAMRIFAIIIFASLSEELVAHYMFDDGLIDSSSYGSDLNKKCENATALRFGDDRFGDGDSMLKFAGEKYSAAMVDGSVFDCCMMDAFSFSRWFKTSSEKDRHGESGGFY